MLPGQEKAVDLIWHKVFGQKEKPPRINWVMGRSLDCLNGSGFMARWNVNGNNTGMCVSGVYWPDLYLAEVAWEPGTKKFYGTALAHELNHARLGLLGISDPDHRDFSWGLQYHRDHSCLDEAVEALIQSDL